MALVKVDANGVILHIRADDGWVRLTVDDRIDLWMSPAEATLLAQELLKAVGS